MVEQLRQLQTEVSQVVTEMLKAQKVYSDEEHVACDARSKAAEAESKLNKKSTGLFTSLASLQKASSKVGINYAFSLIVILHRFDNIPVAPYN